MIKLTSDAGTYLIEQAERIEREYPDSKCRLRLAGGLRAAAADIKAGTDHRLPAYLLSAYPRKQQPIT